MSRLHTSSKAVHFLSKCCGQQMQKRTVAVLAQNSISSLTQNILPVSSPASSRLFSTTSRHNGMEHEYAFEMACSNIKYGEGVTQEVGQDCKNLGAKKVCVMTDKNISPLSPMKSTVESLDRFGVDFKIFDDVRVEPSDESFKSAIQFAKDNKFDAFVAVGGGSVIDTCKAANLYASNLDSNLMDYVNAPIGKGQPVSHTLKPLIAIPTTAGTGSETTGTAVFDLKGLQAKTGISNRNIRPTLGILDPLHLVSMPERVAAYSGIDVLCHALESFTAIHYTERSRPENPNLRPAYQGNNPISDVWSLHALRVTAKYITRAVFNADDMEARCAMLLASCFAGIGFGNAGCHLPHGMSYPISGLVKDFKSEGYGDDHALVPHGLSVIITAPAVFEFTAPACPERHLQAAEALGADVSCAKKDDAGKILSETIVKIMDAVKCPNGISALGYTLDDIPALVKGTLPQHRVTKLSPRPAGEEEIAEILTKSMTTY